MTPTITAFEQSPDRGKGLARDMRVRWALEEVNQHYDVRLVSFSETKDRSILPAVALHTVGNLYSNVDGGLRRFHLHCRCRQFIIGATQFVARDVRMERPRYTIPRHRCREAGPARWKGTTHG